MANFNTQPKQLTVRLGSDLKFPISGTFESVSGLELLLQDIQQLLLTIPGERVNRPEFGCNLKNQIWENLVEAELQGAASIRQALDDFEPRISVTEVTSDRNDNTGLISFNIKFVVLATDTNVNLVFPFRATNQLSQA